MAASPSINILEDVESPPVAAKDLNQVSSYASEMRELELKMEQLDAQRKLMEDRFNKIQLELLPELMMALGMKKFSLTSGEQIEIKDFIRGSIPTMNQIEKADEVERASLLERRAAAMSWLRSVNADSIIKNCVVAEFGKGQDADAKKIFAEIMKQGFKVKCDEEVNFQTLNSYLKSELEKGNHVPVDPFALFVGKKADIKAPKISKSTI